MADEESSRLLDNSKDYRTCSIAKNSKGYTPGNEYCQAHQDTLSDGDCRGRDPEAEGGSIGTSKDISMRNCSMAKNKDGYTPGDEYKASHEDTISDGDNKGRDPEDGDQQNEQIGTDKDITMRNCLMARNSDGYTKNDQYGPGHEDTLSDGDNKGRDPEDVDAPIGTKIDIDNRNCSLSKNSGLYTKGHQYCSGTA